MRSAIWSTLVCMTCSPPGGWTGAAVVTGEHGGEAGQRGEEAAARGVLVRCVGELLADDAGGQDGPVADGVGHDRVGAEHAALLQLLKPRRREAEHLDRRCVR